MAARENVVRERPWWGRLPRRLRPPARVRRVAARVLVDAFHRYYYRVGSYKKTTWLGVTTLQYPGDLVVLQQIVWETQPDLVIETGTYRGGSALFFASLFDVIDSGEVISIDIDHSAVDARAAAHPRITLLTGDSTSSELVAEVRRLAQGRRVMLNLDADHREPAVRAELDAYASLVAPGCYAVVADSNITGHPIKFAYPSGVGGPYEAIRGFVADHPEFEVDASREYHLVTFLPTGYLRRVA